MNVAFLTHEPFYPPSGGGSAEALYLVGELVRRDHQVHVFCPAVPNPQEVEKRFGIVLHAFTTFAMGRYAAFRNPKYLVYPFFLRRLVERVARETRFDLVLSQHAISAVTAGWLKRSLKTVVVTNFLDYLTGFMEAWPRYAAPRTLLQALEKFELSLPVRYGVDGVMTVSDPLAEHFIRAGYPQERVKPIYFGYDADRFRCREPAETAADSTVVMHGSFDQHHLGSIAREGVATVLRERPQTRFRFVGQETASLKRFCREVRSTHPQALLECAGFKPYDVVARELAQATLGIVPYEETTGGHCAFVAKIVEYLGVGLPVVSTPLESARRYFGDEPAVRFSRFDGPDFGRGILEWLSVSEERRRSVGQEASRRVAEALDWRVVCRNAVDFVESIQRSRGEGQR